MDAARTYPKELGKKIPSNPVPGPHAIANTIFSIWPYRLIRIILAVVFLWSGFGKLLDPASFAAVIDAFGLVPENWTMVVAVALPAIEVAAAVGLLIDMRGSLATITALLILFLLTLAYGLYLGLDIDCGCFGPQDPEAKAFHGLRPAFYRDIVMLAGVVYLYFWRYFRSVDTAGP